MSESRMVTIPLEEYEGMKDMIKKQQEAISVFTGSDNVVLVDRRHNSFGIYGGIECEVPKVSANEKLAKGYLKKEFDELYKDLLAEKQYARDLQSKIYELESKKNKWFNFS